MRPARNVRTTLNQVAERAGVSLATASLVLGGKASQHRISEETYRRVKQAAEDLDYVPNLLVRSMQRGRTHVLSFFNAFRHRGVNDIYMDQLSTAIELAAGRYGYDVLVHCDFSRSPQETYRALYGGRADGLLLFAPLPSEPLLPLLRASRLPVVLLGARDTEGKLSSVKDDVQSGMRQVAETLVSLGHTRIAAIVEEGEALSDAQERAHLLGTYLQPHGVSIPDDHVKALHGNMRPLLESLLCAPDPPTAIFCWRDRVAYWVLEHCESLDIAVPEQLSIIGYDGVYWPATTRHLAASVKVDLQAVADAAVHLLDQYITGHATGVREEALPVSLLPGTTLGPAPARTHT
ncbi:MAG TPA: LacI family DNA-binding transcriptional regulator [Chthonomonadaceae bacterium]|nr:LacI family DNA-binding transcriptional regulator [Chthonomonadaceae bacterium]